MIRAVVATLVLLLAGCASARDYSTLMLYGLQRKVMVFAVSPCAGPGSKNPALLSAWVHERDAQKLEVVCRADCTDCQLRVRQARTQ